MMYDLALEPHTLPDVSAAPPLLPVCREPFPDSTRNAREASRRESLGWLPAFRSGAELPRRSSDLAENMRAIISQSATGGQIELENPRANALCHGQVQRTSLSATRQCTTWGSLSISGAAPMHRGALDLGSNSNAIALEHSSREPVRVWSFLRDGQSHS